MGDAALVNAPGRGSQVEDRGHKTIPKLSSQTLQLGMVSGTPPTSSTTSGQARGTAVSQLDSDSPKISLPVSAAVGLVGAKRFGCDLSELQ